MKQRIYYIGEQQLIEDLKGTLECKISEDLVVKVNMMK